MANVLAIYGFVFAVALGIGATGSVAALFFQATSLKASLQLHDRFRRCLLVGVVSLLPAMLLFAGFLRVRDPLSTWISGILYEIASATDVNRFANDADILTHLLGYSGLIPWFVAIVVGLGGWSTLAGNLAATKFGTRKFRHEFGPVALAGLACFLPFVGWLLIFPVLGLSALGSGWIALFSTRNSVN